MLNLIYGFFLGFWRRCFGSDGWDIPILEIRAVQHVIGFLACCFFLWLSDYNIFQCIVCSGVLQGLYWARAVGPAIDAGTYTPSVERYEKEFWDKWCKFLVKEECWYGYFYDFLWMLFRYEVYAIIISIILLNPLFLLSGFLIAFSYTLGHALTRNGIVKTMSGSAIAEILSGFFTGLLIL